MLTYYLGTNEQTDEHGQKLYIPWHTFLSWGFKKHGRAKEKIVADIHNEMTIY